MFIIWKLNPPVVTCEGGAALWNHLGPRAPSLTLAHSKLSFHLVGTKKATSPPPEAESDREDQGVQKVIDTKK